MMNKPELVIFSDPHFGVSNFSKAVFEEQMAFYEKQMFPYVLENKINKVICCGDFFHHRDRFDWHILNELKRRFFQWFDDNGVKFHIIVGNHDTQFKDRIDQNSLNETTKQFGNTIVYDKTCVAMLGSYTVGFVPWIVDPKAFDFPTKCDILIGHLELKNFPMVKGINSRTGYESSQFGNYKYVFSGHYHIRTINDNVHMIGTPYQLTWNDYGEVKGFYVLDNNFDYEFVQNQTNPKYVKLYWDNGTVKHSMYNEQIDSTPEECLELAKRNYCRLYVQMAEDQLALEQFQSSLQNVSCNDYKIEQVHTKTYVDSFDSEEFDESFEEESSTIQLIISCLNGMTFEQGIDINRLIKYTKEEYQKAVDEANGAEE